MQKLVIAIMLLGVAPYALAETYILSPPAVLDSCNEEFENVANALLPGDELILNDGVYSQACARKISINGTEAAPIVIRAADGATPLITRPNSSSAQNNNIELSGSHYTIRGFRFQYGSSGVRFMVSNNITLENSSIFDTLNNALTMNSGATDSHVIRNNEIYNTGLASGSTEGEGMYIGQHSGGSVGTNHLIENNYIHDLRSTSSGGNDGIEIKFGSGGNIIRGNVIHDTNIGQEFPCIFVYGHGAQPNVIENNLVYNCGEAILVTADAIIRNNVILNSSINGIHLRVQSPAPNVQNVTIVNNTVYGSHPVCAQLRIGSAPNVIVANNAFYCDGSTAIAGNGFANATFANNAVRGGLSGVSIDNSQFIQGTPAAENFTNPGLQDFRLIAGSALIDAGDSTAPDIGSDDFAGTARISGAAVDIGAHEFSSSTTPSPTLTFEAPASVVANSSAQLTWSSTNATNCVASDGWQGSRATSGSETTPPLTADTQFTLTCSGPGGSVVQSLVVAVTTPVPSPTLTFEGPASVVANSSAQLTWSSTNATDCVASDGWQGSRATSGSETTPPLTADTQFTLTCSGEGGSVVQSLVVAVTTPVPSPTLTFEGPASVVANSSAQLTWSSTNATDCVASDGWQGSRATSGSETTPPLTADTQFTLTCSGPGGSVVQSLVVAVTTPVPSPTLTFEGPASVVANSSAQLTWSSTNATNCVASDGWQGSRATSGSETTPPLTADTQFTLTCRGEGGSVVQSLVVAVTTPVPSPTLTFEAPVSVVANSSAQLTWSSTNATECAASDGWQGSRATSGSETTAPLTADTRFTLTCNGPGGSVVQTLVVDVVPPPLDADRDGLPDAWEQQNFGDLSQDATGDPDADLMQNLDEYNASTDPNNSDSDGDGLTDGEEVTHSTNPLNSDTDNDGSSDFEEVQAGSDPVDSSSTPQPVVPPVVTPPTDTGGAGTTNPVILVSILGVFLLRRKRAIS